MATYYFYGFDPGDFTSPEPGKMQLNPDWDVASNALDFEILDDDAFFEGDSVTNNVSNDSSQQTANVYDPSGSVVASGSVYLEESLTLIDGNGGSVKIFAVEIGGTLIGYIADGPVQPGSTYSVSSTNNVTDSNAPAYTDLADQSYDQDSANSINGTTNDDTFTAGTGDDTISASGGNDSIAGGTGNDQIDGGAGNDSIEGGAHNDSITGGSGADTIGGGSGADTILAGDGDDVIDGGGGDDSLIGGGGSDTITGGDDGTTVVSGSINTANYATAGQGYTVTAQNISGGVLSSARTANVSTSGGGLGASGTISDSDSGQDNQLGFDKASGLSETLIVQFDNDVTSASFSFESLFTDGFGEVGHWAVYDDGVLVAEADFTEAVIGSGAGTVDLSGLGAFDQIVFTANLQTDGTDGSDYVITDITYEMPVPETSNDTIDGGTGDDVIFGGSGDDSITGGLGNDQISGEDGADTLDGGGGNDSVDGGAGADVLDGGSGSDTLIGGAGDDTLDGGTQGTPTTATSESLSWSAQGADEADLSNGFTQDTGVMNVAVSYVNDGSGNEFTVESSGQQYTAGGEPFDPFSGAVIGGDGNGPYSTTTLDFNANSDGYADEVENVQFRLNDIDSDSWTDYVVINAYDADGNVVPVTITQTSNGDDIVSGNTITGANGTDNPDNESGSALVDIAGPVAKIEIIYENTGTNNALIHVTDVHFDTIATPPTDDDVLTGGAGDDVFVFGGGDDTITDFNFGNSGALSDGDTTNNDFINLAAYYDSLSELYADQADDGILNQSNTTDSKGRAVDYSDNAQFGDGSLTVQGASADNSSFTADNTGIVCFTEGTAIRTPRGDVLIEELRPGDAVCTLDNGPQPIMWIGRRALSRDALRRNPHLRPVLIPRGLMGAERNLLVSPQHGMLTPDQRLVRAKFLAETPGVPARIAHGRREVVYIHLLFEHHQIIFAENTRSESLYPGKMALAALDPAARHEMACLFPALLRDTPHAPATWYGDAARAYLNRKAALRQGRRILA